MKIEANQSSIWSTKFKKEVKYDLTRSTGRLFSYGEILALDGGAEHFVSKIGDKKLSYCPSFGTPELRNKIASIYGSNISGDSILITSGCRKSNFLAFYSFLEPGDELIIVTPTWWPIIAVSRSFGAQAKFLKTRPENAFIPEPDELAKLITSKTKMIVITNPNNPSGSLMNQSDLDALIAVADKFGVWILCDEVYKGIESDAGTHVPSITEIYERGLTTNSVSKVFGMPAIRMGWISGSRAAIEEMKVRWNYVAMDSSYLDQYLAGIVMDNYNHIMGTQRAVALTNRRIIGDWLAGESLVECPVAPASGTTVFVRSGKVRDSSQFAHNLLKQYGTYVVPGAVYDKDRKFDGFFRIGYMIEPEELIDGLERISAYLHSL